MTGDAESPTTYTIADIMKRYRIASTPMIHSPGVFQWIIDAIRPFDKPRARELFAAMGLPEEVAGRLAESDPGVSVSYDEETVIVEASARETAAV
jgi:hypothetical protein